MILVFCEPEDTCSLWLASKLIERGQTVEIVLPDELAVDSKFTVSVGSETDTATIHLADGRVFEDCTLSLVINRMERFPCPQLTSASDRDVVYASEEMRAATVVWFAALKCPVLNLPTPYSPYGSEFNESIWRQLAASIGILTAIFKSDTEFSMTEQAANFQIVVIGDTVLATKNKPIPPLITDAAIKLAQMTGLYYLGLEFVKNSLGEWQFITGNSKPNLISMGSRVIDALLILVKNQ